MDQQKPVCSFPACAFTDQSVACDGRCGRSFHAVCVGLTVEDFRVISSSPHILWVCDDCQDRFRTGSGSGKIQQEEPKIPGKCSSPACFYTEKFVRCDGDCGGSFHAVCVKLPEADLGVISSKPNLMWLCSGCGDRMRTLYEGKSLETAEEHDPNTKLQALHNHLTNILGRISGLFPVKVPHDEVTFPITSYEEVIRETSEISTEESSKNEEVANDSQDQDAAKVTCDGEVPETDNPSTEKPTEKYIFAFGHSAKNIFPTGKELNLDHAGVPNSPGEKNHFAGFSVAINKKPPPVDTNNNPGFKFQSPTTAAAAATAKKFEFPKIESNNNPPAKHFVFLASPMKQDLPKPPEPTHFHLWLAYFEGDTTEADIDYLVRKRMKLTQFERLNVIKLGLGRKRVSFKVQMSVHLKGLALQDDTWPQSLSYHREFVVYH